MKGISLNNMAAKCINVKLETINKTAQSSRKYNPDYIKHSFSSNEG